MKKICFLFAIMLSSIFMLCGCGNEAKLEESAIPVVSDIIKKQLGSRAAKCLDVEITEKISDKLYKAVATLDNGNNVNIMIEDRGDQIYVSIPTNQ